MKRSLLVLVVALVAAAPAVGARPATEAERAMIVDDVYNRSACAPAAVVSISTVDPGWAVITQAPNPADPQTADCTTAATLLLRAPGHVHYSEVWRSGAGKAKPCWAMGTRVSRDLFPDGVGACQTGWNREIEYYPYAVPAGKAVGLRSPTAAERAGILRQVFGTRKRCYPAVNIKVARGNKGWARIYWSGRGPLACAANGVGILMRMPGSDRWVSAWAGSDVRPPCWLTGRNTARALVRGAAYSMVCEPNGAPARFMP